MAKMDWDKASRAQAWRDAGKNAWRGNVPPATMRATLRQIEYLRALMAKAGRRAFTPAEESMLTIARASRLIAEFTARK